MEEETDTTIVYRVYIGTNLLRDYIEQQLSSKLCFRRRPQRERLYGGWPEQVSLMVARVWVYRRIILGADAQRRQSLQCGVWSRHLHT